MTQAENMERNIRLSASGKPEEREEPRRELSGDKGTGATLPLAPRERRAAVKEHQVLLARGRLRTYSGEKPGKL